jgi:HEPN domain-containing protein
MKPHEEWLFKALHDIESSKLLFNKNKNLFDIAIYHTQQCAEKSLKAFLAYKEQELAGPRPRKTQAVNSSR